MMIFRICVVALSMLVTVGCDREKAEAPAASLLITEELKVGTVTKNGHLIIHVFYSLDTPPVVLPVELVDDYGFMIFNEGTLEEPELKVMVASKQDMKIVEATTWEDVDIILSKIPAGSDIHYYGKCLSPTYYGLPDDTWERFMALVQKHRLTYDDTHDRITCNCFRNGG